MFALLMFVLLMFALLMFALLRLALLMLARSTLVLPKSRLTLVRAAPPFPPDRRFPPPLLVRAPPVRPIEPAPPPKLRPLPPPPPRRCASLVRGMTNSHAIATVDTTLHPTGVRLSTLIALSPSATGASASSGEPRRMRPT